MNMANARTFTLSITGALLTIAFVNSVNNTYIKDAKAHDIYPFAIGMLLIGASLKMSGNNKSLRNILQWGGIFLVAQGVCDNWYNMSKQQQTAILGGTLAMTLYVAQKTDVFQNIGRLGM